MSSASVSICPRCGTQDASGFLVACPTCLFGKEDEAESYVFAETYEVLEIVGRGGSGVVHRARHLRLNREVALKIMDEALAADQRARDLVESEGQAMAALAHPNIVAIFDIGRYDGHGYVAMEYVQGAALSTELPLPLPRLLRVADQLCSALVYAHRRGIVHCDVKPQNILLAEGDRVKLTDFGIAQWGAFNPVKAARIMGTRPYMAPELLRGEAPGPRTDIYALGVVLHQMLVGDLPKRGFDPPEGPLQNVLRKASAPADERYATVDELRRDLAKIAAIPQGAVPLPPEEARLLHGVAAFQAFVGAIGIRECARGVTRVLDRGVPGAVPFGSAFLAAAVWWMTANFLRTRWVGDSRLAESPQEGSMGWSRALPWGAAGCVVWFLAFGATGAGYVPLGRFLRALSAPLQVAAVYGPCLAWLEAFRERRSPLIDPTFRVAVLLAIVPAVLDILGALGGFFGR